MDDGTEGLVRTVEPKAGAPTNIDAAQATRMKRRRVSLAAQRGGEALEPLKRAGRFVDMCLGPIKIASNEL